MSCSESQERVQSHYPKKKKGEAIRKINLALISEESRKEPSQVIS